MVKSRLKNNMNIEIPTFTETNPEPKISQMDPNTKIDENDTLKDITDMLNADKLKAYRRRMQLRKLRIYATLARIQGDRDDLEVIQSAGKSIKEWIEGDSIDAETVKEFMKPYLHKEEDEPVINNPGDAADIGEKPDYEEIREEMNKKVKEAKENANLTETQQKELLSLFIEYQDTLRLRFGKDDPTADIKPFKIKVQENAIPLKVKGRGYTPMAMEALRKTIKELIDNGLIYANPNSRWAAPVLCIPKPGRPGEYRICVDLRHINHLTIPTQWVMPDIETIISQTKGSKYFATYDLLQGYWQGPVHEDSQEYYSFMTPWGVYTPTRLPQGGIDSALYFQANIQLIFKELIDQDKLILWIDDLLIHAKTWEEFEATTRRMLELAEKANLKIHIKKSDLCNVEAHWCGRIVNGYGVTYHPRNYETLINMETPETAGELCQFVAAITWMVKGIPRLAEEKEPLSNLLEDIYKIANSREKRKFETLNLHHHNMWDATHEGAFKKCKQHTHI